jgi:hypothetical protein
MCSGLSASVVCVHDSVGGLSVPITFARCRCSHIEWPTRVARGRRWPVCLPVVRWTQIASPRTDEYVLTHARQSYRVMHRKKVVKARGHVYHPCLSQHVDT